MEPTNAIHRSGEAATAGSLSPSDSGLLDDAKSLWQELRGLAHDQLTLSALQTKLAGKSWGTMMAAGLSGHPFLIWSELAFKTGEMMLASAQVIGHRAHLALAGPTLNARDRREFSAMIGEKISAAAESAQAMTLSVIMPE